MQKNVGIGSALVKDGTVLLHKKPTLLRELRLGAWGLGRRKLQIEIVNTVK